MLLTQEVMGSILAFDSFASILICSVLANIENKKIKTWVNEDFMTIHTIGPIVEGAKLPTSPHSLVHGNY